MDTTEDASLECFPALEISIMFTFSAILESNRIFIYALRMFFKKILLWPFNTDYMPNSFFHAWICQYTKWSSRINPRDCVCVIRIKIPNRRSLT